MSRSGRAVFAPDLTTEPYWWRDAPPEAADREPLPERVDVAVIGSGYCGLSAALELARAGTSVAVLDSGALGGGASSRNGGMVGGAVRLDWQDLARRYGREPGGGAASTGARASFDFLERPDRARAARRRLRALRPFPARLQPAAVPPARRARSRRSASVPTASAWCRASASARRSAPTATTAAS